MLCQRKIDMWHKWQHCYQNISIFATPHPPPSPCQNSPHNLIPFLQRSVFCVWQNGWEAEKNTTVLKEKNLFSMAKEFFMNICFHILSLSKCTRNKIQMIESFLTIFMPLNFEVFAVSFSILDRLFNVPGRVTHKAHNALGKTSSFFTLKSLNNVCLTDKQKWN